MDRITTLAAPSPVKKHESLKQSFTHTEIKVNKLNHKWVIDNFRSLYQHSNNERPLQLISTPFHDSQLEFTMHMFPYGQTKTYEKYVSLIVKPTTATLDEDVDIAFQLKVWIVGRQGEMRSTKTMEKCVVNKQKSWGWPDYVSRDVLLFSSNGLLADDNLTIYCEISYLTEKSLNPAIEQPKQWANLISDFTAIYKSRKLSDVTLVVKGQELRAHKIVLAARSPVFMAMFDNENTLEAQESRVEITDFDVEVFEALLQYLYTANVDVIKGMEDKLLSVAEKYEIEKLKSICEHSLCSKITPENVSEVIALADLHNATILKAEALSFFKKNVQQTVDAMFDSNNTDLVVETFREMARKRSSLEAEQDSDYEEKVEKKKMSKK